MELYPLDHPMCTRCGRPLQMKPYNFGICYCLTESDEKAAKTKARLDADFAYQRKRIEMLKQGIDIERDYNYDVE